jgi:hypothetical protein
MDVKLGAPVGAYVQVVHALDRSAELRPRNRAFEVDVKACAFGWRRSLPRERASIDTPYSTTCVIFGVYS